MAPFVSEEEDSTGAELEDVHLMNDELKQHLRRQQAHLHRCASSGWRLAAGIHYSQMVMAESTAWAGSPALVRKLLQYCGCRGPRTELLPPAGPPAQLHLCLAARQHVRSQGRD